jgi:hypothetical protein
MGRKIRRQSGSAITETGPALLFFFMLVFFPLLDVLYMVCGFGFAWFLHNEELREVSVSRPNQADTAITKADADFFTNAGGMANFLKLSAAGAVQHPTSPVFTPDAINPTEVTVTTRVNIKPWLYISIVPGVPGLSTDVPLTFTSSKPQEENGKDG